VTSDNTFEPTVLRIATMAMTADDVMHVQLTSRDGTALPAWQPGAHLGIQLPSGVLRQYSLCGDPEDLHAYGIAVLRQPDGRGGSIDFHEHMHVGRDVPVASLRNNFALAPAPRYLLLAGGIGVTPLLAMARELQRRGRDWHMVYGGRSRSHMAFVPELAALAADRVQIWAEDERGLPPIDKLIESAGDSTAVYCCGPTPMIAAVEAACATAGHVDLHLERFSATESTDLTDATAFEVELSRSGVTVTVPADRSILDVVLDTIGEVNFSCEEGVCGTCETAVLSGVPDHRDQLLLPQERESNETMMICVSRSKTARLVLDL
jgi:ferredoxin-NADP reductase